jgi:M6 family metalloprotease-like protein
VATLRQAIEPQRERGTLPRANVVSVGDLHRQFHPNVRGSTRSLILKLFEPISEKKPWAIILCRFKGAAPHPDEQATEALYRRLFEPGSGGLVEYWRDVSLGAVDITGSRVFGWVEVDIPRDKAGGTDQTSPKGPGRSGLVDAAIKAVLKDDDHRLDGFFSQLSVYLENWSKPGVTQDGDWATWAPYAIDGSADGRGKVNLTPPHAADIVAHEMGHGFGMKHDADATGDSNYHDPCCIMSQSSLFARAGWTSLFGPAVCLPHLVQRNWMYQHRLLRDDGAWMGETHGATFVLAPINDPGTHANLGVALKVRPPGGEWDYLLEYVRSTGWNRGLKDVSGSEAATVFVRRILQSDIGETAAILGSIPVPTDARERKQFVEPTGNTRFEVQRFASDGRIVKVNALKL